jgi:hypothetical protein
MRCVRGLQMRVALVERMAVPVAVQRVRCGRAMFAQVVGRAAAFVDVVAHEQHEVQFACGDFAVRHEEALLVVLAGGEREAQPPHVGVARGCSACVADRADGAAASEAVPIVALRLQALRMDVHAEGARRIGHDLAPRHRLTQCGVAEDFVAHGTGGPRAAGRLVLGQRRQPGPEHDAVRPRLAARNAERERVRSPARRRLCAGHPRRRPAAEREPQCGTVQCSAVQCHEDVYDKFSGTSGDSSQILRRSQK